MIRSNAKPWIAAIACTAGLAWAAGASATPVVYTLRTVADGRLGNHVFSEALVTLRLVSDTIDVQTQPGSNGGLLYTNSVGVATVSITDGSRTTVATFLPGEVYVRYDAGSGVVGFGSAISPNYPVALGCDDYAFPSPSAYVADCTQGDWGPLNPYGTFYNNGTSDNLANYLYNGPVSSGYGFSAGLLALPANLTQTTLFSGRAHTCAGLYTVSLVQINAGDLLLCPSAAPHGLRTNRGRFYLQDQIGGTLQPPNPFNWSGWETANVGSLHVEVDN